MIERRDQAKSYLMEIEAKRKSVESDLKSLCEELEKIGVNPSTIEEEYKIIYNNLSREMEELEKKLHIDETKYRVG